jgi:hypothetical protein
MKKLAALCPLISVLCLLASGCASVDWPGIVREAGKDHANVKVDVHTLWGGATYERSNPRPTPVDH